MKATLPLLITSGEPAGIGLDVVLQLYDTGSLCCINKPIIVLADVNALMERANQLGITVNVDLISSTDGFERLTQDWHDAQQLQNTADTPSIAVWHLPCDKAVIAGCLEPENAKQVIRQLTLAAELAIAKKVSAIVTAPVQKSVINDAINQGLVDTNNKALQKNNNYFSGHTEFFQHMADCPDVVMMLANDTLKVALVTTHIALKDVPNAITKEKLHTVLDILLADMQTKFGKTAPVIKVCGLNPHAGEGGHMGREEIELINPVLSGYRECDSGKNISQALPADTLFNPSNLAHTDCFLAMYHDQGLTVLKALGFGKTVNLTLGLPFIRTSVDHGTALDIAGTGKANASSLLQAIKMADDLAEQNKKFENIQ